MSDQVGAPAIKVMRLRYAGTCRLCGCRLSATATARYDRTTKSVLCLSCPDPTPTSGLAAALPAISAGQAGASARREHRRRRDHDEATIRAAHPHLGGVLLRLTPQRQSTAAWRKGAKGEEILGRRLDAVAGPDLRPLQDRRQPPSRANLDHLVVCAGGVLVIDAKKYDGSLELRVKPKLFEPPQAGWWCAAATARSWSTASSRR